MVSGGVGLVFFVVFVGVGDMELVCKIFEYLYVQIVSEQVEVVLMVLIVDELDVDFLKIVDLYGF